MGVALAGALLAGCAGPRIGAGETITIGVLAPLTSGVPAAARSAVWGATLAADEINAGGGVVGATITLLVLDDRGSTEEVERAFAQMLQRRVVAIVGPLTDATATAVAPMAERAGIPLVSPGATGTIPYAGSSVFRTSLPAPAQARVLADYLMGMRRARRLTIIHEGNDYGTLVARAFAERVRGSSREIVGTRLYRDGDEDFTRHANGVVADGADAVFIAGYPDEAALILQALQARGVRAVVAGSDALYSQDLVRWAGAAADGLVLPAAFVPTEPLPGVQEFVGKYRRKYGEMPDHFAAQAYDALKVVAFAIRRGGRTPAQIRAALQGVRRFPGATGEITFDRWGAPDRPVAIAVVREGQFELVQR
ncbi:MAG: ABC transporter substrate-binding protein [Armatimonadota bacterium]|nr:ABC transporter substrate-binding protein [Armatimonadota bacterium]MDR7550363.1 ABC transporter substrate-binding protein [Armatimonadota bacterium]